MADSQELVRALYEAFSRADVTAVLGAFDPKIHWLEAESGPLAEHNPYLGPQAVAEGVFMRLATEIEGFTVTIDRISGDSETVTAQGHYRGTVSATGAELNAQFAHIWQVRDGKLAHFQQYTDTHQWREAYGT